MLCLLFCTLVLIGALLLYARLSAPSAPPEEEITRSLTRLAELLEELAGEAGAGRGARELEGLAQRFRRLGYAAAATSTCQMGNGGFITCLHCCFSA